jgi:cell division protein FtsQ
VTAKTAVKTTKNKTNPARTKQQRQQTAARRQAPAKSAQFQKVLRANFRWLFAAAAAVAVCSLLFYGYQKAVASSLFEIRRTDVAGTIRAERQKIEEIARLGAAKTGVWNADLAAIQREIEQQTWVKTAIVSRILPDGLRVRVIEREPKAVVKLASGSKVWVDDEAQMLGETSASENLPFLLLGWSEAKDDAALKKNQDRVRLYQKLLADFRQAEIAARVRSIDLSDLQDVEATVEIRNFLIPVRLGSKNLAERLKPVVSQLEESEDTSRIEKVIAYDKTPVVRYKQADALENNPSVTAKTKQILKQRKL